MSSETVTLDAFQQLDQDSQLRLLHEEGTYVGKRTEAGKAAVLYQLNGFYAELWYEEYRRHIDRIIASDSVALLQPYLDQINVRGIDGLNDQLE